MKSKVDRNSPEAWDTQTGEALIEELWALRKLMLDREAQLKPWLCDVDPTFRRSAVNLAHFLAMRRIDLRHLQERLAWMGVSSLGRAETHVLANVDKVLGILHRLTGRRWTPLTQDEPAGFNAGGALLAQHVETLFGAASPDRDVRIMVTLPSEAGHDDTLVEGLVNAGMDIARINCAHDGASEWAAMAERVRRAASRADRPVRVLMDLGGPKLRTGPVANPPAVVKLKPERDVFGRMTGTARLGLCPSGSVRPVEGAALSLSVDAVWLERLQVGDRIDLTDAREAQRRLIVLHAQASGVLVECDRTAYLTDETRLRLRHGVVRTGRDEERRDRSRQGLRTMASGTEPERQDGVRRPAQESGGRAHPQPSRRAVRGWARCRRVRTDGHRDDAIRSTPLGFEHG